MAFADKKGINLASPFKLQAEELLDVRQQVESTTERDQLVTLHAATAGLRVFVKADKCSYVYNGSGWDKISTSVYTHPTGDGNLHVPATGTTHNNQVLTAGSTAGSIAWKTITASMISDLPKYSLATFGVTASATELNYMKGVTSAVQTQLNNKAEKDHTHGEATLTWGGKNIAAGASPVDGGFVDDIGANRFAGLNSGLALEYSTDGGSTWTSSTVDNALITAFSGYYDSNLSISNSTNATVQNQIRITITTDEAYLYAVLSKFAIKINSNSATGWCTIEAATKATPTKFTTLANKAPLQGWPGWNIINGIETICTYGGELADSNSYNYQKLRFTIGISKTDNNYTNNLEILKIQAFGSIAYITPTRIGSSGHIYGWDNKLNVGFPKNVNAESFSINNRNLTTYFADADHKHNVADKWNAGFAPKLPDNENMYLNGVGEWTTPPDHTYTLGSFGITASATELNYMKGVTSAVQTQLNGKASSSHTHSVATTAAAGFMPKLAGGTGTFLRADGAWATPPNTDTTYSKFTGASTSAAGSIGLVPAPAAGAANRYLRSDGTWSVPPDTNTTYSTVSTSSAGLVPKLTGSTSTYLRADGTWATPPDTNTTYSLGSFGITASATELNYVKGVTSSIQTQLNGKASSSHTHSYLPLSGGTITGPMKFTKLNQFDSNPPFILGIEAFADGGELKWKATSNIKVGEASYADAAASATTASKLGTDAGSATQPVYFSGGVPKACSYTLGKSVPSNAVFTDTNTWRGIQDNLTSSSTSDSLSANQGKVLKGLVDGKAAASHTHSYLPLSGGTITGAIIRNEGGSWISDRNNAIIRNTYTADNTYQCVASQKTPSGNWSIGSLGGSESLYFNYTTDAHYNSNNNTSVYATLPPNGGTIITSVSIGSQSVKYATSAGSASSASSATTASTATALSSSAGSTTQPIYFSSGKPAACSYSLAKSVPSNAVFTDTNTTYGTATSSAAGLIKLSGSTSNFLRGDGTWATPSNTDTKVTNTLGTTTKAYITGTTSSSTNTGTQVFDTGVYLTDTAGELHCNTSVEIGGASLQWDSTNKRISIVFS